MKRRQLLTYEDAKPAKDQHQQPCSDCPFARAALAGWLGNMTAADWIAAAHSEAVLFCHTLLGAECAGGAIFRANMCKVPRDPTTLRLPADKTKCFANPKEFQDHHAEGPSLRQRRRSDR